MGRWRGMLAGFFEAFFYKLAKMYIRFKKPLLIVVAGSVGKTSTKLTLGQLIASEKTVSYMDESYNSGLGLPLSVFGLKTPRHTSNPFAWMSRIFRAVFSFFRRTPGIMILEYGIDSPGEIDSFIDMAAPDIALLTAVMPEHMELLVDMDTVAQEEMKIVHAAKDRAMIGIDYVDDIYLPKLNNLDFYGESAENSFEIHSIDPQGALVTFRSGPVQIEKVRIPIIAKPLISHTAGAVGVALSVGISPEGVRSALESLEPTPGRNRVLAGVRGSTIIDDTVNFSPEAGIVALESLRAFSAKRRIVVFGNMHELGDYEQQGFDDVLAHLGGFDMLVTVGPIARKYLVPGGKKLGYIPGDTLFDYDDSIAAGRAIRDMLGSQDAVLVKGPFGGYYLEECVKILLDNPERDARKLVRQSDYWPVKKQEIFGPDVKFY